MDPNCLLVNHFIPILIVVSCIEVKKDVSDEEQSGWNVNEIVNHVGFESLSNLIETQGKWDCDAVEDGVQENNDIPNKLGAVVLSDLEVIAPT